MSVTVNLVGVRIEKSEFFQNKQYTVVAAPAPDVFSFPSKYRVTSDKPIGNVGSVLDLQCTMKGVVRPKTYKDKETGQQKQYDECDVYFDVFGVQQHVTPTVTK